jgi:hypothetical protein
MYLTFVARKTHFLINLFFSSLNQVLTLVKKVLRLEEQMLIYYCIHSENSHSEIKKNSFKLSLGLE